MDGEALRRCAGIAEETARLECFDRLTRPEPVAEPAPVTPATPATPAIAVSPEAVKAPPQPEPAAQERSASAAGSQAAPATAAPPASTDPVGTPPTTGEGSRGQTGSMDPDPAAAVALSKSFGAEHLGKSSDDDEPEAVIASVRSVRRDHYRRLHFEFDNGQIWRQVERRHFPYPKKKPFDVTISRGMLGDYQLRVDGEGRMTRIRRLR